MRLAQISASNPLASLHHAELLVYAPFLLYLVIPAVPSPSAMRENGAAEPLLRQGDDQQDVEAQNQSGSQNEEDAPYAVFCKSRCLTLCSIVIVYAILIIGVPLLAA